VRRQGLFISRRNLFRLAVPSIIAYAATRSKRAGAFSSGKTPKRVSPAFGRGEVNLLNFQPAGDGLADDLFAFRRAIASVPPGQPVRVRVPRPPVSYRTTAPITSEGRLVTIVLEDGASLSGVGVLYVDRVERMIGSVVSTELRNMAGGLPGEANLVGKVLRVESRAVAGIGRYYSYDSHVESPTNPNGGDIGFQQVATWHGRSVERPFGMFGAWNIAVSPLTSEADSRRGVAWGCVGVEWNPVYHGPDLGWAGARGEHTWAVGMQVVPEGWAPTGNYGGHILAAYVVAPCGRPNARRASYPGDDAEHLPSSRQGPFVPKSYNGLLLERDSIAPGGRGVYAHGDTSGEAEAEPFAPFQAVGRWRRGLDLSEAEIGDRNAVVLKRGQAVSLDEHGTARLRMRDDGRIVVSQGHRDVFSIDAAGNLRIAGKVMAEAEI